MKDQSQAASVKPSTGAKHDLVSETYRIFEYDRTVAPTIDAPRNALIQRTAPIFSQSIQTRLRRSLRFRAYRLLLPDGEPRCPRPSSRNTGCIRNRESVGAVTHMHHKRAERIVIREARGASGGGAEAQPHGQLGLESRDRRQELQELLRSGLSSWGGMVCPEWKKWIFCEFIRRQPAFRESAKRSKHKKLDEKRSGLSHCVSGWCCQRHSQHWSSCFLLLLISSNPQEL